MKQYLSILLISLMGFGLFGCTAEQKQSVSEGIKILKEYSDDTKEKTDEFIDKADKALATLNGIITAAEKDKAPEISGEPSAIVNTVAGGAKAAAPLLPPPFNVILGALGTLLPFGAAWWKARGRANQRTAEEALLISGLQQLKKADRPSFDKFVEYRDKAAEGLLTAKELSSLLEGISTIRATYS